MLFLFKYLKCSDMIVLQFNNNRKDVYKKSFYVKNRFNEGC